MAANTNPKSNLVTSSLLSAHGAPQFQRPSDPKPQVRSTRLCQFVSEDTGREGFPTNPPPRACDIARGASHLDDAAVESGESSRIARQPCRQLPAKRRLTCARARNEVPAQTLHCLFEQRTSIRAPTPHRTPVAADSVHRTRPTGELA